ncbi:unnamed protein product [Trifolium pratense]|uniref:Uncharacterized protein n=1 Tax=Trifolium pratense TaxID=57577 RepID=A0ACB0KBA5_TRIPR|nr:unnamed protein product [Trifolium pratense]
MVEEDKLIWIDSIHGQYSVKSGYNMMLNNTGRVEEMTQENWQYLWKIHAPPKAKHLLWRICKGCLPTRTRLQERRVTCPLLCPLCEQSNEDDWHILFNCNDSLQARQAAGLEQVIAARMQQYHTTQDVIKSICHDMDRDTAGLFAVLLWVLWNNRNDKVWNGSTEAGRSLGLKARQLWCEWYSVQTQWQQRPGAEQQQQQVLTWQKPPTGWYKCNADAGFYNELNKSSAGWCLRDHTGSFVKAGTIWNEGKCSIIEGEALALLEAMKAVKDRGITHAIFETDSKNVVDAIHNLRGGTSEFSSLICDIKNVMMFNPNFVVKFIKRQANMVAHTLARAAISWSSRYICETLPPCITPLLNN